MGTNETLTPEQQAEQQAVENAARDRAESESIRFLQSHLDYARQLGDNQKLADFIREHKLEWTAESLEIAYQEIGDQLQHRTPEEIAANAKAVQAKIAVPRQPEVPWHEYMPITKAAIARIPRADFKRWMKDANFVAAVNAALHGGK